MALHQYLPQDRLRALADGRSLPGHTQGAALLTDISGFTVLTEALAQAHGERRGAELLAQTVGAVYDALIAEVERRGGSTIAFAGDSMLCWFDGGEAGDRAAAARRAVRAALAMQQAMQAAAHVAVAGAAPLALKVSVASGRARRFTVGDPAMQTLDLLAGAAVTRVAAADTLAVPGDLLVDEATAVAVGAPVLEWRSDAAATRLAVVDPSWPGPAPGGGDGDGDGAAGPDSPDTPDGAPAPLPDAELLRPWVLPFVHERESAGLGLFVTDLRPVVALFLRFDGLAGPEEVPDDAAIRQLDQRIAAAQRILQHHGGVLLELVIGDKGSYLYGAFGAARAHEDDAVRALRAARALGPLFRRADGGGGGGTAAEPAADPAVETACIGVASGTLRVGGYGGRTRQSFGAQGDAVNAAARLMMLAQPGEILASGRVRAAAAHAFVLQPRPPIALKGKAEPMPVFALQNAQRARARRLQEADFVLPMVGREPELQQLAAELAGVADGRGALVVVQGEPGMGKTRLLAEGARLALRRGFIGLGGFGGLGGSRAADGLHTPYRLWHGVWAALFDIDPALPPRAQARAVQAAVARCVPGHAEAWPLLAPVLALDQDLELPHNDFTTALSPQDRKRLLEALLVQALQQAAADAAADGAGVLLVLEDLHEAEALTLDLLAAVLRGIAELPVLVLASQRSAPDVGVARWPPSGPRWLQIELKGLDATHAEQLIRAKLAAQFPERAGSVPPALIQRIVERADGNPFTIEELLDDVHDRGLDPRQESSWQALSWPVSLRSLVLSRIDRLPMPQQLVLKLASVIGSPFGAAELRACHPARPEAAALQLELDRLCALGLVQPQVADALPTSPEPRYAFRHRVMHEVAYDSIASASRRQLHEQVALHLERDAEDSAARSARALAHHWARAERPERAGPWLRLAGEQAAACFANDEAVAAFTQVLAWLPADAHGERIEVLWRREALFDLLGRHEERRRDLAELETLLARRPATNAADAADTAPLQRQLALRSARLALDLGDVAAAEAGAAAALHIASAEPAAAIDAGLLLARVRFAAGRSEQARTPLEQAVALARRHGLADREAQVQARLGTVAWQLGHYDEAEALLRAALPIVRSRHELREELDLLNDLGVVAKSRARFGQAVAHYEQALAIARRIGDRSGEAMLLNNIGSASLAAGDFWRTVLEAGRAARIWSGLDEPLQLAAAWINLGEAHRELGQHAAAATYGERALALLRARGQRRFEAIALENLGRVAFARGEHDHALALLGQALALAREIDLRAIEASTLLDIGRVQLALGRHRAADEALADAAARVAAIDDPLSHLELQTVRAEAVLASGGPPAIARECIAPWLAQLLAPAEPRADAPELPLASYLVAWRVLRACGDAEAAPLLERARAELRRRAARIPEPSTRRDFLQVAVHQALLAGDEHERP